MAKFIELEVVGNSNDFENGKHLINADLVTTVTILLNTMLLQ